MHTERKLNLLQQVRLNTTAVQLLSVSNVFFVHSSATEHKRIGLHSKCMLLFRKIRMLPLLTVQVSVASRTKSTLEFERIPASDNSNISIEDEIHSENEIEY